MRYDLLNIFMALILCAAAVSCSSPKPVGPIGEDGKQLTWEMMNTDQRKLHMKNVVMPRAGELFRNWKPEKYSNTDCTLCHDKGTASLNFQMPASHLPVLSGDWTLSPEFKNYPETTKLKLDKLVPLMSEALGKKSFSLITRRGFGCYSCHMGPSGPMFGN